MTADAEGIQESAEQTMESLLEEQTQFFDKLKKREVVWVKVVQVQKDQVLVETGEKNEGVIPASEFTEDGPPKIGRRVPAVLVKLGRGDFPTMLSTVKAKSALGWDLLAKAHEAKERVRGKVTSAVKGGFLVDVSGVAGFMPMSLADLRPVRKPDSLVGTGVRCYILELDRARQQMILSRRAVLEEDAQKRRGKILDDLKPGKVRVGRISRVHESGLFVDIGGVDGLVHVADVAWKEPEEATKKYARGQKIRVRVISIDTENSKVSLGIKQLSPHPADLLRKKYPFKKVVQGTVSDVLKDGVRIKLPKGDTAFCPVRELQVEGGDPTQTRPERGENLPPVWPKTGDKVGALVTGIHNATFEVSVSIRRYESVQDRKRVALYMKKPPPLTLGQLFNREAE
ncbi:MAG: S1 RNA-binding domain-containing protein [Elusimicrobiota bacterium]